MWTRKVVSVLLATILAVGLVAVPRQASAIDDNWWFLDPPPQNAGDPDTPGLNRSMDTFRALGSLRVQAQIRITGIPYVQLVFFRIVRPIDRTR